MSSSVMQAKVAFGDTYTLSTSGHVAVLRFSDIHSLFRRSEPRKEPGIAQFRAPRRHRRRLAILPFARIVVETPRALFSSREIPPPSCDFRRFETGLSLPLRASCAGAIRPPSCDFDQFQPNFCRNPLFVAFLLEKKSRAGTSERSVRVSVVCRFAGLCDIKA
jgi:hypothetical protein